LHNSEVNIVYSLMKSLQNTKQKRLLLKQNIVAYITRSFACCFDHQWFQWGVSNDIFLTSLMQNNIYTIPKCEPCECKCLFFFF